MCTGGLQGQLCEECSVKPDENQVRLTYKHTPPLQSYGEGAPGGGVSGSCDGSRRYPGEETEIGITQPSTNPATAQEWPSLQQSFHQWQYTDVY